MQFSLLVYQFCHLMYETETGLLCVCHFYLWMFSYEIIHIPAHLLSSKTIRILWPWEFENFGLNKFVTNSEIMNLLDGRRDSSLQGRYLHTPQHLCREERECVLTPNGIIVYFEWKRCKVQLKCDGTQWRTGGEVKGKLANGVGSQYSSHYLGTWCIQHYYHYNSWNAHLGCQ